MNLSHSYYTKKMENLMSSLTDPVSFSLSVDQLTIKGKSK